MMDFWQRACLYDSHVMQSHVRLKTICIQSAYGRRPAAEVGEKNEYETISLHESKF